MSNANRDYAIVYDVKNSSLILSRPLVFYITDINTSNIFVRLVTKVNIGNGVDQYTDIEEASSYALTMRVIKPNNEVKSIEATQHELGSIFQFDLTEDFKDIPGKYICELIISTIVSERQELITSDPFNYEVKRSILSNVSEIIETEDTTVEKLLNNLEASKIRLFNDLELAKTNLHNDLNATSSALNSQIQASDNRLNSRLDATETELSSRLNTTEAELNSRLDSLDTTEAELSSRLDTTKAELSSQVQANDNKIENIKRELSPQIKKNTDEINNINNNIPYEEYDRNESTSTLGKTYKHYDGFSSFVKKTYGRYETATVSSIIANSDSSTPQVLGTDTKGLATYLNRDSVALYIENTGTGPILTITEGTTFTANTVTLPKAINISDIKVGMIVDIFNGLGDVNSNWYVGIIKEIDLSNNTLVMEDGFYLCRNDGVDPTKGIPTNGYTVRIQNNNKVWTVNSNLFIKEGTPAGTNMELGVFSYNTNINDVGGIDLINFEKPTHYGVKARGKTHGFNEGFVSENNAAHFVGKGGEWDTPLLKCITPNGYPFEITMDGALSMLSYRIQLITESASLSPSAGIVIANGSNIEITLPSAHDFYGRVIDIISTGTGNLLTAQLGDGIRTPTQNQQQISIAKSVDANYRALRFVSDGGKLWFCLSDL